MAAETVKMTDAVTGTQVLVAASDVDAMKAAGFKAAARRTKASEK